MPIHPNLAVTRIGACDGVRLFAVVATSGSATVTCSTAAFSTSDVGKIAVVYTDSTAGTLTTIASVTNATTVVLAANAGITTTTGTGYMIYGTDDSPAIQFALDAAAASAVSAVNTNNPNQPIPSGNVIVTLPGVSPQALSLIANQVSIPSGVILDAQVTLANVLPNRNAYCVDVRPSAVIRRLIVECVFGGGVTCGTIQQQAHIKIEHISVWHAGASSTFPANLVGNTSATGGTLTANTRYYVVTAFDSTGGESNISSEATVVSTGSTSSNSFTWDAVPGAVSYRIYRGTASGGQNLYFTSVTNAFTDTGGASSNAYPVPNGIALRLLGYHYEITTMFLKVAKVGAYHWAGSDCHVVDARFVGCVTALRAHATNQLHYSAALMDTCGGSGSLGGVVLDNGCSNVSISCQAFQVSGTSGTLSPVINVGPLSTTAQNTDLQFNIQANNTGGSVLKLQKASDVLAILLASNVVFPSGITSPITTGVVYGSGNAGEIAVQATLSAGITPSSGTKTGTLRYQQSGANVLDKLIAAVGLNMGTGIAVPATATSAGVTGDVAYDASFLYVCVATNTWKRTALTTW